MDAQVTIRKATEKDIPAVVELWEEHQEYHVECDAYFERSKDAKSGFREYLEGNLEGLGLFVAEVNERKVGFVLGEVDRRPPCFAKREYGMIDDLGVTEEWRGRGIGHRLVERMMVWFEEQGIDRIEARVLVTNPLASTFWEKMGFTGYMESVYKDVRKR